METSAAMNPSLKPYKVIWGVIIGYFMIQLSLVPVTAMLPTLRVEMQIGVSQSGWVMTIYLLTLTGFLLIAGRLGDQFFHERIFKIGLAIYGIASLLAGFSPSYEWLMVCRGVQGLGAALLSGNSMAIVHKVSNAENRGKAIGLLTSSAAFGSLLGIIIGSIFIQFVSWRWIFFISVPLAVLSFVLVRSTGQVQSLKDWRKVDIPGGLLLYLILIFLTLTFSSQSGGHTGHGGGTPDVSPASAQFIDWRFLAAAALCFVLFVIVEKRASEPMVFFSKFKNPGFSASLTANFILHFVMISVVFFVPFIVEEGLGLMPLYTAAVYLSVEFMNAVLPPISSHFYHTKRWYWLRPFGMFIIASGFIAYYFLVEHVGLLGYILLGGYIGMGMGVFWSVNNHVIMVSLEDQYRGFASGMLETTRQMGHALSSGISAVAMGYALDQHSHHLHGGAGLMESIYAGTKAVLMITVFVSLIGFMMSLVKARNEKKYGETSSLHGNET